MTIVDTNILMHHPAIFNELDDYCDLTITIRVIEELDALKTSSNSETAFRARKASRLIKSNEDRINFINKRRNALSVDDELVYFAQKYKATVITNDLNIQIKCKAKKIECRGYSTVIEPYSGVIYDYMTLDANGFNHELEKILLTKTPPVPMYENQFYIILNDKETKIDAYNCKRNKTICAFIYKNGKLEQVDRQFLRNEFCGKISAKNVEQDCLIKLLKNKDISIVLAAGTFGTGKSFLLVNYALQELENGQYTKIVYVPNNSFNANSREVGTLPG